MTQTNNQGEKVNVSPYTVPDKNDHYDVWETFVDHDGEKKYHHWCSVANEHEAQILSEALAVYAALNKTITQSDEPLPTMVVRSRPTKAHSLHTRNAADLIPFPINLDAFEPREYSHVPAEMAHQIFREDQTDEEIAARMGGNFERTNEILREEYGVEVVHPSETAEAVAKRAIRAEKRKKKASKKRA